MSGLFQQLVTPAGKVFIGVLAAGEHLPWILESLSAAAGKPVTEADLVRTASGRPEFPGAGFDANWSHSRSVCALAYSFDCRVGVDIEFRRPRSLNIAERFYAPAESEWLFHSGRFPDDAAKLREFYRLWCRKEACFKCAGGELIGGTLSADLRGECAGGVHLLDLTLPAFETFSACLAVMPM